VDVEDLLHRLAEADSDRRRPELCDGRYLLTYLLPDDGAGAELDVVGYAPALRELRSPLRRILGYFLVGLFSGPMTVVETDHRRHFYLGHALEEHPGARFLFLMSADPPNQDEAWAILELG
jgi:hypothetical protein